MKPSFRTIINILFGQFFMFGIFFYILFTFALPNPSSSKSNSASASASKSVSITKGATNPVTSTTFSQTVSSSTVCVECYQKLKTKDCQPCKCECTDGTKYSVTQSENSAQCPKNSQDVPCSCKNSDGRVDPNKTYVNSQLSIGGCVPGA